MCIYTILSCNLHFFGYWYYSCSIWCLAYCCYTKKIIIIKNIHQNTTRPESYDESYISNTFIITNQIIWYLNKVIFVNVFSYSSASHAMIFFCSRSGIQRHTYPHTMLRRFLIAIDRRRMKFWKSKHKIVFWFIACSHFSVFISSTLLQISLDTEVLAEPHLFRVIVAQMPNGDHVKGLALDYLFC